MYIRDLRPGGACLVKVIYGPGLRAPTITGRDNMTGPTPSAGALWGRHSPSQHHKPRTRRPGSVSSLNLRSV